ncbi:hypothetical protein AY601_4903 [Pedobacter cryoconitis]|uniref:Uncharacterized protein n=1 Tax=Pedobacter cryoconitis TaxID=188932 RepID=A0A127VK89_9SPHI|nr:hypothetical protein [Pedobacter cryoconitis]AMQ01723.1 hypothetical protein AY601_4903 [Pedobacter cryoconitis]
MPLITVTGGCLISYKAIKDYHFSAQALYEEKLKQALPLEEDFTYEILMDVESEKEAKQVFLDYIGKLNDLGIAHHAGHLAFITQSLIKFEGNYINDDAVKNDLVIDDLKLLERLLIIQRDEAYETLNLEFTSKKGIDNKKFEHYCLISNKPFIKATVASAINSQFEIIKSKSYSYSFDIANSLSTIKEPSVENISNLVTKASAVSMKPFKMQLLYTVCLTLRRFLNDWSLLNPNNAEFPSDQARVIYYTCKIHGLLSVTHDVERDALNYTRMLLKNNSNIKPMNGIITN